MIEELIEKGEKSGLTLNAKYIITNQKESLALRLHFCMLLACCNFSGIYYISSQKIRL